MHPVQVDIAIVVDAASSNNRILRHIEDLFSDFIFSFFIQRQGVHSEPRAAVVFFCSNAQAKQIEVLDLTDNPDKIDSFVSRAKAVGDPASPREWGDAIEHALHALSWGEGVKTIMLFTDGAPADIETGRLQSYFSELASENIHFFGVTGNAECAKTLEAFKEPYGDGPLFKIQLLGDDESAENFEEALNTMLVDIMDTHQDLIENCYTKGK